MGKFIISEEEKKRILNMHHTTKMKPFLFEEGEPVQPTTSTTPPTQPTPNPEPAPSTTLPENPTKETPLKAKVYPLPKSSEENYFLIHLYELGSDVSGIAFKYTFPTYQPQKLSPLKKILTKIFNDSPDGVGKWVCSTKESYIKPERNRPIGVEFTDVVKKYFESRCDAYAKNVNQGSTTGPTTV